MGRPSLLDKPSPRDPSMTIAEAVIDARGKGQSVKGAALGAGISDASVYGWQSRGALAADREERGLEVDDAERPYLEFFRGLERAWHQGVLSHLEGIREAADRGTTVKTVVKTELRGGAWVEVERTVTTTEQPQWTARAWLLERGLPAEFARRVEVSGPDGGPIPIEDRARVLADDLAAFQAGVAAQSDVSAEAPA